MAIQVNKNKGASEGSVVTTSPSPPGQSLKLMDSLDISAKAHTVMLYGDSRTLKSWEWLQIARHVLKTTGKLTRVIYADLGGFKAVQEASEAGLIKVFKLADAESPSAALMKLTRGEWPIEKDGIVQAEWLPFAENGGDEIGLYVFDSFTSLAALAMQELIEKRQRVGQDVVGAFEFWGEKFGNPSMAHYGSVQWALRRLLANIANLPVPLAIVTALEGVGKDEAGRAVYGPMAIGKALTDSLPAMTGDLWRFELDNGVYKAWFSHHPDKQSGVQWPANLRLDYGLEQWYEKYPEGYMPHGIIAKNSLVSYLEFYAEMSGDKAIQAYKDEVQLYKGKVNSTK